MLQNFLYLCKKKTQVVFFVFHFEQLSFSPYECLGLCRHRLKVAQNEKRKKKLLGFSFYINIANVGSVSLGQKVERQSFFSEESIDAAAASLLQ